ncbi:response regulator [Deinococcus sp. QL22]|uniref:response regulator n=1 Tax=Deinococcus sp. QL22 TaxID=2939437 RepID=UPI002017BFC7|nr:response regulator [Deinococcus sp. QL22]UQN08629.1 response regulator [Deinococcus sp. QL22]
MTPLLQFVVIDDNLAELFLITEVFATFSTQVTLVTYQSGEAALKAMQMPRAVCPDILLLDINMPGISGFEVLKTIKADEHLKLIPVVMLTTSVAAEDIVQAYSLLANSYLVKSTHFSSFVQQIESLVNYWTTTRLPTWPAPVEVTTTLSIKD